MSATFWNRRRRAAAAIKAQQQAVPEVKLQKEAEKPVAEEKPKRARKKVGEGNDAGA